jgi:hypothetical protein
MSDYFFAISNFVGADFKAVFNSIRKVTAISAHFKGKKPLPTIVLAIF